MDEDIMVQDFSWENSIVTLLGFYQVHFTPIVGSGKIDMGHPRQ